MNEIFGLTV